MGNFGLRMALLFTQKLILNYSNKLWGFIKRQKSSGISGQCNGPTLHMAYPGQNLANIWPHEGMIVTNCKICIFVNTLTCDKHMMV